MNFLKALVRPTVIMAIVGTMSAVLLGQNRLDEYLALALCGVSTVVIGAVVGGTVFMSAKLLRPDYAGRLWPALISLALVGLVGGFLCWQTYREEAQDVVAMVAQGVVFILELVLTCFVAVFAAIFGSGVGQIPSLKDWADGRQSK